MNNQTIEIGARVQVINHNLDGTPFIEGFAIVRGMDSRVIDNRVYCSVEFVNEKRVQYYRWIDVRVMS